MLQELERYDDALAAAQQALAIAPGSFRARLVAEAARRALAETNPPALPGTLVDPLDATLFCLAMRAGLLGL